MTQKPNAYGIAFSNINLLKLVLIIDSTIMLTFLMSHKLLSNALIFDIDKDFTIPSLYGYALLSASAWCIYLTSRKVSIYRPLSYLFVFFLVDDIISIHEHIGKLLGHYVIQQNILFFTKRSLGETIFISIVGSIFSFHFIRSYVEASRSEKKILSIAIILVAVLGTFGVLFDLAHDYYRKIDKDYFFWMGFFEDVGEMFTISVMFWFSYNLYNYYAPSRRYIERDIAHGVRTFERPALLRVEWHDRVEARACLVGYLAHKPAMVSATRR